MTEQHPILICTGASEADELASALRGQGQVVVLAQARDLCDGPITGRAVLDVSHCFDVRDSAALARLAAAQGVPYARFLRPRWQGFTSVQQVADAMPLLSAEAVVFSATGWPSLDGFAQFPGRRVHLRQSALKPEPVPFDFVEIALGQAPYSVAEETALFQELGITHLMCRNLGGEAGRSKIIAAQALGVEVILIDRPPVPEGVQVLCSPAQVRDWVAAL